MAFLNIGNKKRYSGTTLIEAMTFLLIFALVTTALYSAIILGTNYILDSKARLGAAALANEKLEIARNLDYDDLGTKRADGSGYGVPAGEILDYEEVSRNTRLYYVFTTITYIDDAYDGKQGGSPNDTIANDYKKVRIKVAWENDIATTKGVVLVSTFPPNGLETAVAGSGSLAINVIDNSGLGIPNATVHITNSDTSTNTTVTTDSDGNYTLVGAEQSSQKYKIEVSKSGYYPITTYAPYPTSSFDPGTNVHASVVSGTLSSKALKTDKFSSVNIETEDSFGASIGNIEFNLKGGREKGTDPATTDILYEYDQDLNTSSDGSKSISDLSFGNYFFTLRSTTNYDFIKVNPGTILNDVFDLPPDTNMEVKAVLADKNVNSLLVKVKNNDDGSPIAGASVQLKSEALVYDTTLTTDQYGQCFFPTSLPELTSGQYELKVTATNFQDDTSTISIDDLVVEDVNLIAS